MVIDIESLLRNLLKVALGIITAWGVWTMDIILITFGLGGYLAIVLDEVRTYLIFLISLFIEEESEDGE